MPKRKHRSNILTSWNTASPWAKRIKYARLCRGLSQNQLAQKAGVSLIYVHKLERGAGISHMPRFKRVVEALDCELRVSMVAARGHPLKLDTQKLGHDGRVRRRRTVRLRVEAEKLAERLGYLNALSLRQKKYSARNKGPSAQQVEALGKALAELEGQHEFLERQSPSPQTQ